MDPRTGIDCALVEARDEQSQRLEPLTAQDGDKFHHVDETFENVTDTKDGDNDDEDGGNIKLSPCSGGGGWNKTSLLLNSSVDKVVENHKGDKGDKVEYQHRQDGRYLYEKCSCLDSRP